MARHIAARGSPGLRARTTGARDRLRDRATPVAAGLGRVLSTYVRPVVAAVTALGWTLVVLGIGCWILAGRYGWVEMAVGAGTCLFLLVAALPFLVGRTNLEVEVLVQPPRVTVGDTLAGTIMIRNRARTPLVSTRVELPIGTGGTAVDLPLLLPGREAEPHSFGVPTDRRGVITVGPATSVRSDPLGVYRREISWTERSEVFVHPRTVPLGTLARGLLRDLEGSSSQHISMSDLSFHMLREYVPGDDLRHVHWLSSAKHGELLIRQYLDTRRSHLVAIVDSNASAYRRDEDYETAMSVGASLISCALRDGFETSFLSGTAVMSRRTGRAALDACARAEPDESALAGVASIGARLAPDCSLVMIVTGPNPAYLSLQRAASQFSMETARFALRVDSTAAAGLRARGDMPVLTLARLEELGMVLKSGLA